MTATQLTQFQEKLNSYVKTEGLKQSEPRWQIATLILDGVKHLHSQEIVKQVQKRFPKIGTATVYRNLKLLVDAKVISESMQDEQGRALFEPYGIEHHDHVVCVDCGHIFEFHDEEIELAQNKVLKSIRFKPKNHRHVLYASCEYKKNPS